VSPGGHCIGPATARERSPRPRDPSVSQRIKEYAAPVLDYLEESRRACTAAASVSRDAAVISMSMQASVTDWP
jgi:hypothetical protein